MSMRSTSPDRPIPSGRIPGSWGLYIAIVWTAAVAAGRRSRSAPWVFGAAVVGLALAWAYSAPPLRLKQNGWLGQRRVRRVLRGPALGHRRGGDGRRHRPTGASWPLAALYSLGAHGIMTLNDFKSVEGDAAMGIRSLPVQLGVERAAVVACVAMAVAAGRS